jgi:hypothetical protein
MPELKSYAVFISHAWTYSADYYRLEKMLHEAPNFKWRNCSVPKHDALDTATNAELIAALRRQISPTNIVLILAGMYVPHSKWIQREIDIALGMKKPIVGIVPWGQERTPQEVQSAAKEMVGWNTSSIVSAIRRYAL